MINASISLLQSGTTREGNRTQALIQLNFHTTSSGASKPLLSFFSDGIVAISSFFIPAEYRPAETVEGFFRVIVSYFYQDEMSLTASTAVYCKVYGADTEHAGRLMLKATPPTRYSGNYSIIAITVMPDTNPTKLELGYSSKSL